MRLRAYYFILSICTASVYGQKTEYLEFSRTPKPAVYSVFDSVEFVDSRLNKDYIGILQKKNNDKLFPIWLHNGLSAEIKMLIDSAVANVPKEPRTILINFRNFFINGQNGVFDFHVECYAKWDDQYWIVYRIDSSYTVKGQRINDKMKEKVNEVVNDFVSALVHLNLSKKATVKPLTFDYINDIDNSEKRDIPVFNTKRPEKGIYFSYTEFKNNLPQLDKFWFLKKKDKLKQVYRRNSMGEQGALIPRDSVYAVYDGEDLWIAATHEYAQLNKRGQNFFFRTVGYERNKAEAISISVFLFGLTGAVIASFPHQAIFEFRLNHINGKFILLRRADE